MADVDAYAGMLITETSPGPSLRAGLAVEQDKYLLTLLRYFERNGLRANLVTRADERRWCSLWPATAGCRPCAA